MQTPAVALMLLILRLASSVQDPHPRSVATCMDRRTTHLDSSPCEQRDARPDPASGDSPTSREAAAPRDPKKPHKGAREGRLSRRAAANQGGAMTDRRRRHPFTHAPLFAPHTGRPQKLCRHGHGHPRRPRGGFLRGASHPILRLRGEVKRHLSLQGEFATARLMLASLRNISSSTHNGGLGKGHRRRTLASHAVIICLSARALDLCEKRENSFGQVGASTARASCAQQRMGDESDSWMALFMQHCVLHPPTGETVESIEGHDTGDGLSRQGSLEWYRIGIYRARSIQMALLLGADVLFIDTDVVVFRCVPFLV